jgi:hypothetical protein
MKDVDIAVADYGPLAGESVLHIDGVVLLFNKLNKATLTQYRFLSPSSPNSQTFENSGRQHNSYILFSISLILLLKTNRCSPISSFWVFIAWSYWVS